MPDQRQRLGAGEHGVAKRVAHEDGTPRVQTVEHRPIGDRSVRPHALLEPADHFQPAVGFAALVLVEADLNPGAELGDGQRLVVQRAVNLTQAAFERVHVTVDEPGHGDFTSRSTTRVLGPMSAAAPASSPA